MTRAPRTLLLGACLGSAALVLSGCSLGQVGLEAHLARQASSAALHVTPASDAPVAPSDPVVVTVESGRLTDVVLHGPSGDVAGTMAVDARTWSTSAGVLDYGTTYTYTAHAVDRLGLATTLEGSLRTIAPTRFLGIRVSPREGGLVGVGMPITVTLDHDLSSDADRAAFQRTLAVTVNGAAAAGAWSWSSDSKVMYRMPTYWPAHATIVVSSALKGARISHDLWGEKDRTSTFRTDAAMVSYVDMHTDQMRVTRDGVLVRTIPITTGKAGFETRSGVKVIMGKERTRIMDASTGGTLKNDPEYYRLKVEYAMRITNSGEFLHAAPWSVAHQGHTNVSHGCTGMSTANAAWMYASSRVGDVVVYTGTTRKMTATNGIGVWNLSWPAWLAGSAVPA